MELWNLFMAGLVCGMIAGSCAVLLYLAYKLPKNEGNDCAPIHSVAESAYEVSQQHELLRIASSMLAEVPIPAEDPFKGRHLEAVQQGLDTLVDDMKDLNRISRKVLHGY